MEPDTAQVTLHINGSTVRLETPTTSHQRESIARHGVWERHIGLFLATVIRRQQTPVVFDVGANIGYHTILASKFGARVVAFETHAHTRAILERNMARNDCQSVRIESRIVGAEGMRLRMVVLEDFEEGAFAAAGGDENVLTLDAFSAQTGLKPTIIKIDTEGRDLDIIRGALGVMQSALPIVVFEFQSCMIDAVSETKPADLFRVLQRIGYSPYLFRGHTVSALELVTYDILHQIYDLYVGMQNGSHWDVVLWPPGDGRPMKAFDRSRLDLL